MKTFSIIIKADKMFCLMTKMRRREHLKAITDILDLVAMDKLVRLREY